MGEDEHAAEDSAFREKLLRRCKERSLYLLSDMDRTESRMREKLRQSGKYGEDIIDETIDFLKKYSYIDDRRYAEKYIESFAGRKSLREIEKKLYERGVPMECIREAMDSFKNNEESAGDADYRAALAFLRKKTGYGGTLSDSEKKKLYAGLLRRGFSYEIAKKTLELDEEWQ